MTRLIDPAAVACAAAKEAIRLFDECPDFENPTQSQSDALQALLQDAYRLTPTTLIGVKVMFDLVEWDIRQNGIGPHIGVAIESLKSGIFNLTAPRLA